MPEQPESWLLEQWVADKKYVLEKVNELTTLQSQIQKNVAGTREELARYLGDLERNEKDILDLRKKHESDLELVNSRRDKVAGALGTQLNELERDFHKFKERFQALKARVMMISGGVSLVLGAAAGALATRLVEGGK